MANDGVKIVAADLAGDEEALVKVLAGIDVVISTIYGGGVMAEKALINASKAAGVRRYLPCFFATIAPPKGALLLREMVSHATGTIVGHTHSNTVCRKRTYSITSRRSSCHTLSSM